MVSVTFNYLNGKTFYTDSLRLNESLLVYKQLRVNG